MGDFLRQRRWRVCNVNWRLSLLGAVTLAVIAGVLSLDAIPQDIKYHWFADKRSMAGVPNFLDVVSNLPFLIVAIYGWRALQQSTDPRVAAAKTAWSIFFLGIALTAFGSAYYHWEPNNTTLIWDRLPMTIGFMSLISIVVGEYFSADAGKRALLPLLALGIGSVAYWAYTESQLQGDLRPYAVVQFLPMLLIPLTIVLYRKRSELGYYIGWMIAFYVLAKVAEHFDDALFSAGHLASGHTLKHLIAALAPAALVVVLQRRSRQ